MMLNAAKCFAKLQSWVLPLRFLPLGPRSRPCPHTKASAWFGTNSPKWHQSKPAYLKNMTWHRGYRISQRSQTQILLHLSSSMGKPPGTWWGYVSWSWRAPLRLRHLTLTPTLWWSCKTKEIWAKGWERAQNVDRTLGQVVYITLEVLQLDERIDVRCGPLSMALPPVALVHQGSHREVHLREHLGRWWSLLPATLQIWKMDLNWILTVIRAQTIGQSPAKQRKIEDLCSRSYWETLGDHGRPWETNCPGASEIKSICGSRWQWANPSKMWLPRREGWFLHTDWIWLNDCFSTVPWPSCHKKCQACGFPAPLWPQMTKCLPGSTWWHGRVMLIYLILGWVWSSFHPDKGPEPHVQQLEKCTNPWKA